ncbi:MAG: hypothetical protein IPG23_08490 [Burkholderiales bacterium]|nr:hypothetical protein [Burkholderiales bacterium]
MKIVQGYSGPFEATLLVNCLLGLLVVPKETVLEAIPEVPFSELANWGLSDTSIKCPGRSTKTNPNPSTLRGLVANLRHSVAHFRVKPVPASGDVHSFEYTNDVGFHAIVPLSEMRCFVEKLSSHLSLQ